MAKNDNLLFINLQTNPNHKKLVEDTFEKYVAPLYGDQSKALNSIFNGADRNCEILLSNGKTKGLIVYKTALQNEFELNQAFELKTLLLFDSERNKGFGAPLLNRAEEAARSYKAKYIYGTLSKKILLVYDYFKNFGWVMEDKFATDKNDIVVMYKELIYESST